MEGEVNNGGFNQYYWNTDDRYSEDAVDAFEFFSATDHAALMKKANGIRTHEAEIMKQHQKQGTLDAFSESYDDSKLGPCDDEFYALTEDLSALRIAKIRESPELFAGD